jgi:hypothetical protein
MKECPICHGSGQQLMYKRTINDELKRVWIDCEWCHGEGEIPMTNRDHVKSMSNKELARIFSSACLGCPVEGCNLHNYASWDCERAFEKWLEQPWDGDDDD